METADNENTTHQDEKTRKRKYSSGELIKALKIVKEGKYSISEAAKKYNIPRQTLSNKYFGISPIICDKPGPEAVLGKDVEKRIEEWMLNTFRRGFCPNKEGLIYSVKMIIETIPEDVRHKLPFKNNTPGKGWFSSFRKRHPKILEKYHEFNKLKQKFGKDHLDIWFSKVESILEEDNVEEAIIDPSRIYIMDEVNITFCKNGLNLSERKKCSFESSVGNDEDKISFLFAANAVGQVAPLMIMTKSNQETEFFSQNLKNNWRYESTECGTLTCEKFYRYISDLFYPYLHDKQNGVPVVIFLSCDFPYLSLPLSNFCEINSISMMSLPRNSVEIESLGLTVYNVLIKNWQPLSVSHSNYLSLKKKFLTQLQDCVKTKFLETLIVHRFQSNKLYPFNAKSDAENSQVYRKNVKSYPTNPAIDYLEKNIPREVLVKFRHRRVEGAPWNDEVEYSALYDFWSSIVEDSVVNDLVVDKNWTDTEEESDTEIEYMTVEV